MAYCSQCGQQNPEGAQFCNRCGHKMEYVSESDMDRRLREFGEEVQNVGKKFSEEIGAGNRGMQTDFDRTFGPVGPLVKAVIGFIILVIVAQLLNIFGNYNTFVKDVAQQVFLNNLLLFFFLFVFLGYAGYLSRRDIKAYEFIEPLAVAVGVTVVIWVVLKLLSIISLDYDINWLSWSPDVVWLVLPLVFLLILLLGYSAMIMRDQNRKEYGPPSPATAPYGHNPQGQAVPGRVYRSGRDRIVGGVCGGLGEHFHIDPIIIRIIWVLLLVASFGTFLLVYLVLWIVIPRNPTQNW